MKVIIDVPEEVYSLIKKAPIGWLERAVANGTPLQKETGENEVFPKYEECVSDLGECPIYK